MADLEFSLPLPPEDKSQQASYLNACRDLAWEAVCRLLPRSRTHWPAHDKVKCQVILYSKIPHEQLGQYLAPVVDAIGGVLWHPKKSMPMIFIDRVDSDEQRIAVSVTRRKLISEDGPGKHYEW